MEMTNEVRAVDIHEKAKAYYQASEKFGYKFLMELKMIRDEKLFKFLGCDNFAEYTENFFGYDSDTMNIRIQDADAWEDGYTEALRSYGKHKTRQLGLMPKKDRDEVLNNGIPTDEGIKSIHEATTREIEKYKKQLKEKETDLEKQQEQIHKLQKQILSTPAQEIRTVEKEVVPADYENIKSDNQQLTEALKEAREREKRAIEAENKAREHYNQLLASRAETEENSQKYKQLTEAIHNAQNELTGKQKLISNYQNLSQLLRTSNEFLSKASAIVYQDLSEVVSQDGLAKRELTFLIERTERFLSDLRKQINNKNIIEGEIINE